MKRERRARLLTNLIYPENAAEKLGFPEIRELIKSYCLSPMGRNMVDRIQVMAQFDQISKFLKQTDEFRVLLTTDSPLPIQTFYDIKSLADKARVEGTYLTEDELARLSASLSTVFAVIEYFREREGIYPALEALFENLPVERAILKSINSILDDKGKIRDNASKDLAEITASIARTELEARKRIDQVFRQAQSNGWTADGYLTVREGRLCIPVLAENKRKIRGFIHDESASGQTVFIEPDEVFQLYNLVRDLEFDRRREIIRLLTALTTEIRPFLPVLISYHGLLTKLDFVRAKALFALSIDAALPVLVQEPTVELYNAKHPLLMLSQMKEGITTVPLNIKIDNVQRIIVVSGPNAGGKSVCMKTVGLLQLMVQSGLLIPAEGHSKMGVFKQVFADIGDDQSIESDLSTYSAHLAKMKYFSEHANSETLVLIDEFGTGTDPQFGGPIAESVLEDLNSSKVRGVITTHYSNLKTFANSTEGLENASMLFDNRAMRPLYILSLGKPGSSYAFEIAEKIGLSASILESARRKIGTYQKKVDTLLVDLERDRKDIHESRVEIEKRERSLKAAIAENEKLKSFLQENKNALIREAKEEAQSIIRNANKLIENTISSIKQNNADKDKTRQLREGLQDALKAHSVAPEKNVAKKPAEDLKPGDWVRLRDSETTGQIIDIAKGNAILAVGELRSVVKIDRLEKAGKSTAKAAGRASYVHSMTSDISSFSPELDVRGYRGEEAVAQIEKYLDRAVMLGLNNIKIIHGKGDGILRKLIRQYLQKYPEVEKLEDEHADRGGDGITYVYLR